MQPLRAAEVLEPVVAEVAKGEAVEGLGEQVARRLREKNLCAVCRARHAGSPVHVEADVAVDGTCRLAGVEPHADADDLAVRPRMRSERSLSGRRGSRCRGGGGERDEERIPFRAQLDSAVGGKSFPHDAVVFAEEARPALPDPLGERRRAFDVREEQGDRSGRQLQCSERLPRAV